MTSLHQLLTDFLVLVASIRSTRRHDEPGTSVVVQVAIEILKPEAVGVGDGFAFTILPLVFVATPGKPNGNLPLLHQPGF